MSWETVKAAIEVFDGSQEWSDNGISVLVPAYDGFREDIELYLEKLYSSDVARPHIEYLAENGLLKFAYSTTHTGFFATSATPPYIVINFEMVLQSYFFNDQGVVVAQDPAYYLMHELAHALGPDYDDPPISPTSFGVSDDVLNSLTDLRGGAIDLANLVALDLGDPEQYRASYPAHWSPTALDPRGVLFEKGFQYTSGQTIDNVRLGGFRTSTTDDGNNTITTVHLNESRDLIFGLKGRDRIFSGAGGDFIYGGEGNDYIDSGEGDDWIYGEDGEDTIVGGVGNDWIHGGHSETFYGGWIDQQQDTLDYSTLGAGVRIFLAIADVEEARVGVVTVEKGEGEGALGYDVVQGVEKFIGTDFADALVLNAGTDFSAFSEGGLLRPEVVFDLGTHAKSGEVGDTIIAQNFGQALKFDLSKYNAQYVQILGGDERILVKGADAVVGTDFGDEIIGNNNGNALIGGGGGDTIVGGSGRDRLVGGYKNGDVYSDDGAVDTITSGGGADWIYFGDNDRLTDRAEAGSKLYYADGTPRPDGMMAMAAILPVGGSEGVAHLLTGGEAEAPPANPCSPESGDGNDQDDGVYEGADGARYILEGGSLKIEYNGGTVYLDSFRNGDGGIRLKDARPDTDQAECQRDPLIIDLNGDRNVIRELFDSTAYFDLDNDGFAEHVAWTLSGDGFLVRDLNGNGKIDNGTEMFGSGRAEQDGGSVQLEGTAGFAELAELDSNGDGLISAADPEFATLRIWMDENGDGQTDEGELKTLDELGLVSISLTTRPSDDLDCGCDGTEITFASTAYFADGSERTVYDAYLSIDQYDSREIVDESLDLSGVSDLPFLLGTGTLSDLNVAMARDPGLEEMVREFAALDVSQASEILERAQAILLRWTGADTVAADGRGVDMNARWLAALEQISGSEFIQAAVGSNPRADAAAILIKDWREIVARTAAKLLGQTDLGQQLLPGLSFEAAAFFSAADGADLTAIIQSAASQAPSSGMDATSYWTGIVAVLDQYRGALGIGESAFDASLDTILAGEGIAFTVADLRTALIADGASRKVVGTIDFAARGSGNDLFLIQEDAVAVDGAGGDDRYVVGNTDGTVRLHDRYGKNSLYLVDHAQEDIVVSAETVDGQFLVRISDAEGTVDVTFELSVKDNRISTDISTLVFSDGSTAKVLSLLSASDVLGNLIIGGSLPGEIIQGTSADEFLVGLGTSDIYRFGPGDGDDTISDNGGDNEKLIVEAALGDVTFATVKTSTSLDLLITIVSTGETVRIVGQQSSVQSVIESIEFSDGTLSAGDIDQILGEGTPGDDLIEGSIRDDDIRGLEGNDTLRGGGGIDTYHFDINWGADQIIDEDLNNIVSFGAGISSGDISVSRAGKDGADLQLEALGNSLTIVGGLLRPVVAQFTFADGISVSLSDYISELNQGPANAVAGTGYDDDLVGTSGSDWFVGNGGNDVFTGNGGLDTYVIDSSAVVINASDVGIDTVLAPAGSELRNLRFTDYFYEFDLSRLHFDFGEGTPDVTVYGSLDYLTFDNGDTILFDGAGITSGSIGDDFLYYLGGGSAIFTPGAGNDVMIGGTSELGDDTYRFEVGFGQDIIYDMGGRNDRIEFLSPELSFDNADLERSDSDLVISFASGDRLTVEGFFWDFNYPPDLTNFGVRNGAIETIVFGGGGSSTHWSAEGIVSLISSSTPDDDLVMVSTGVQGSRNGGAGNDILYGSGGKNIYYFGLGYGHDIIKDTGLWDGSTDEVRFIGLSSSEVSISRSEDDPTSIIFTIDATGETLTIDGTPHDGFNAYWFEEAEPNNGFSSIRDYYFSDVVLTKNDIVQHILTAESTMGDDRIVSFNGYHDGIKIDAGAGNDHITLLDGNDTIVATQDSGHDVIDFKKPGFMIEFSGINPDDVVFLKLNEHNGVVGRHLLIQTGSESSLVILNGLDTSLYSSGPLFIYSFPDLETGGSFGDGNPLTQLGRLGGSLQNGTEGNDILQGPSAPGTPIDAGAGDDLILGSPGTDRVIFETGYGVDRYQANGGALVVTLGGGLTGDDIALRWLTDEPGIVELSILGTEDRLLFDGSALVAIEAADGVTIVEGKQYDPADSVAPTDLNPGSHVIATSSHERFVAVDGGVALTLGSDAGEDFFEDSRFSAVAGGTGDLDGWTSSELVLTGGDALSDFQFLRYESNPDDLVIVGPSGERLVIRDQFALGDPEAVSGWQSVDVDGDGQADWQSFDLDDDGANDFDVLDTDSDGVPNWLSPDFDGDGHGDWVDERYASADWDIGFIGAQDVDLDGTFDTYFVSTYESFDLRDITGDGVPDEYSLNGNDWLAGPTDGGGAVDWSLLDIGGDGLYELEGFGASGSSGLDWISGYSSGSQYQGWEIENVGVLEDDQGEFVAWRETDPDNGHLTYYVYSDSADILARDTDGDGIPDEVGVDTDFDGEPDVALGSSTPTVIGSIIIGDPSGLPPWVDPRISIAEIMDLIQLVPDEPNATLDLEALKPAASVEADVLLLGNGDSIDSLAGDDLVLSHGGGGELRWSAGDGNDVLRAPNIFDHSGEDVVRFDGIADPGQLRFLRSAGEGSDLIVEIVATGERLVIESQLGAADGVSASGLKPPVERFVFEGGFELTAAQVALRVEGVDLGGANVIESSDDGGLLDGGAGDDMLLGGTGDDIYIFGDGYAEDRIVDAGGNDRIRFGEGIEPSSLYFSRVGENGEDLLIEVMGLERLAMTVEGQFSDPANRVETLVFENGETIGWEEIQRQILEIARTEGDDEIAGFMQADLIEGGLGQDRLEGRGGDDHIFGGPGRDTAVFSGSQSDYTVTFEDGFVTVTDNVAGRDGTDRLEGIEDLFFRGDGSTLELAPPNIDPTSGSLSFNMQEDGVLLISMAQLLAVVSDADGDALELISLGNETNGSAWVGMDGEIRFRPTADFNGAAGFSFTVSDGKGGTATGSVDIQISAVNDAPRLAFSLDGIVVPEDSAIDFLVPSGAFIDPDGDALTLSARLAGGDALPDWLEFDGTRLTGTPPANFNGELELEIAANDGTEEMVAPLQLTILPVNDAPVLDNQPANQSVEPGQAFAFTLPFDMFSDPEGDPLNYQILLTNGDPLPDWMIVDGLSVSGTAPVDLDEPVELAIIADDGRAASVATFLVTPLANPGPALGVPIGTIEFDEDSAISFAIPSDAFVDPDGDALTYSVTLVGGAALPSWLQFDGLTLTGQPPADYNGDLELEISASDGELSISDTVTLSIAPVNDAPVAYGDSATMEAGSSLVGTVVAYDVDGDTLTFAVQDAPTNGNLILDQETGEYSYTPAPGYTGDDSFVILVSDGAGGFATSMIDIAISPPSNAIYGTQGNDSINGTENNDVIFGLGGDDGIYGQAGDDILDGGPGNDTIVGGAGNDQLIGGDGNDSLYAGPGNDLVWGGDGNDIITGDDGDDVLDGGLGDDQIYGGSGNDFITGGEGGDTLTGDAGDDHLDGGAGDDKIYAGSGNDIVIGGDGDDIITGDDGNDFIAPGSGNDMVYAGSGIDTLSYFDATADWTINLAANQAFSAVGSDAVYDFEHAEGGSGADTIIGNSFGNTLSGNDGNDSLTGGAGDDQLFGGNGNDTAFFAGELADYSIVTTGGTLTVTDDDANADGDDGTDTIASVEVLSFKNDETVSVTSPIILDLDGNGITTISARDSNARFDLNGDGQRDRTSWIGATDGFLFLDRDGNGTVSGADELSFIDDLPNAKSDLDGLRAFDSNGDGLLSAEDERFADFAVWQDANGDGIVDVGEILSLEEIGLESLNLTGIAHEGRFNFGDVAVINTGNYTLTNGTTRQFYDAALTYFPSRDSILDGGGFGFLDRFPGRQFPWLGQIAERIPRLAEFQETLGQFFEDLRERLPVNLDLPIFDWFDDWQPGQAAGASQTAGIKKTLPTRIVPMAVELDETDEDTATPTDFVAGARERPSLASAMSRIDQRLQLMVQDMAVFGARDGMEGLTRRRESLMVEDWYA